MSLTVHLLNFLHKPDVKIVSVAAPQAIKVEAAKPATKKVVKQSIDADSKALLEKVAIKFLQQDLDRLLLK